MNGSFWLGVAVIPAVIATVGVVAGLLVVFGMLWVRFTPSHWALSGPQRHARPAGEVFRFVNVAGGQAKTFRKLLRVGPWSLWVIRYAPGNVEDREPERIP